MLLVFLEGNPLPRIGPARSAKKEIKSILVQNLGIYQGGQNPNRSSKREKSTHFL
jgi:hypothetical protein